MRFRSMYLVEMLIVAMDLSSDTSLKSTLLNALQAVFPIGMVNRFKEMMKSGAIGHGSIRFVCYKLPKDIEYAG